MYSVQIVASIEDESAGPSYSVVRLAEALAVRGGRSAVMSLAAVPRDEMAQGVRYHRFRLESGPSLLPAKLAPSRSLARAVSAAAREGALLHAHGLWRMPNVYPGVAARRFGVPLVLSPRGMLGQAALAFSSRQKSIFWHLLQRRALQSLTCFHATAPSEVDDIRAFGLDMPVAIIPNGIDVAPFFQRAAPEPNRPRQVLYLGRIHPKKGIDRLLSAWAILKGTYPDWELRIVGPSEQGHVAELKCLAHEMNLRNVRFEGALHGSEKTAAYLDAALFVLPTLHENFGMVVAEALALGIPTITTIGAPWKGLVTARCGWWVDHGPEPLAKALKEGMELSDYERALMGARGRDWMRRDFSWESVAAKMELLYRWCAGRAECPEFVVK